MFRNKSICNSFKEEYEKEIKEAKKVLNDTIGTELQNYGYWEIIAHPDNYQEKLISDLTKIKEIMRKSQIKWHIHFPSKVSMENLSYLNKGIQFYFKGYEGGVVYQSGLFILLQKITSEEPRERNRVYLVDIVQPLTIFFLFFKRFYGKILPEDFMRAKIALNGCRGRELYHNWVKIKEYIFQKDRIFKEEKIKVGDLKTSYKEIAREFIKHLCLDSKCELNDKEIEEHQNKIKLPEEA